MAQCGPTATATSFAAVDRTGGPRIASGLLGAARRGGSQGRAAPQRLCGCNPIATQLGCTGHGEAAQGWTRRPETEFKSGRRWTLGGAAGAPLVICKTAITGSNPVVASQKSSSNDAAVLGHRLPIGIFPHFSPIFERSSIAKHARSVALTHFGTFDRCGRPSVTRARR
jgi:hypothetical protein